MPNRVTELHNIMPIANIPSVLEHGILSHEQVRNLTHEDISMPEIQERRDTIRVPNGLLLHQYANLYFHARNPMMYKRRHEANNLCILSISINVFKIPNVVITDRNASSNHVSFYFDCLSAKENLDFNMIYAQDWTCPEDQAEERKRKSIKCAEVLVPNSIPVEYIQGAYVVSVIAENSLKENNFSLPIKIKPSLFFR
ncbi:MAG: DUF4433 domain-containing protein [Methylococcaceae bacterium]